MSHSIPTLPVRNPLLPPVKLVIHCDRCFGRGYQPNEAETGLEPCPACDGEGGKSYRLTDEQAGMIRLLLDVLVRPASPTEQGRFAPGADVLPFREP